MFIEDYNDFLRNLKVETMSNLALLNHHYLTCRSLYTEEVGSDSYNSNNEFLIRITRELSKRAILN